MVVPTPTILKTPMSDPSTPTDHAALTDTEWRQFQQIPDQGYSHRAWINRKIQQRLTVALERERADNDRAEWVEDFAAQKADIEWYRRKLSEADRELGEARAQYGAVLADALDFEQKLSDQAATIAAMYAIVFDPISDYYGEIRYKFEALETDTTDAVNAIKAEALREAADEEFTEPYPEDVFAPLSDSDNININSTLADYDIPGRDRISADMFRRAGNRLRARAASLSTEMTKDGEK